MIKAKKILVVVFTVLFLLLFAIWGVEAVEGNSVYLPIILLEPPMITATPTSTWAPTMDPTETIEYPPLVTITSTPHSYIKNR